MPGSSAANAAVAEAEALTKFRPQGQERGRRILSGGMRVRSQQRQQGLFTSNLIMACYPRQLAPTKVYRATGHPLMHTSAAVRARAQSMSAVCVAAAPFPHHAVPCHAVQTRARVVQHEAALLRSLRWRGAGGLALPLVHDVKVAVCHGLFACEPLLVIVAQQLTQQVERLSRHQVAVLRAHKLGPRFFGVCPNECLELGVELDAVLRAAGVEGRDVGCGGTLGPLDEAGRRREQLVNAAAEHAGPAEIRGIGRVDCKTSGAVHFSLSHASQA
eukprot:365053-Chlamydomonas_euryale.AAC.11